MPPSEHHQPGTETIYADGPAPTVNGKAARATLAGTDSGSSALANHDFDFSQTPEWSGEKEKVRRGADDGAAAALRFCC